VILVTGGAGFIGSNIVAALEEQGADVAVCDGLGSEEKWRNLAKRRLADVFPPQALAERLERDPGSIAAVIHMGAISSTTATDADEVAGTNFGLSKRLWEWCALHRKPFVYASSAATYGDGTAGFVDDWSEEGLSRLRPLNLYGWSKHLFDRFVSHRIAAGGVAPPQWAGLKFFNVYGPNEYHKGSMRSVVAQLYPRLRAGEPVRLFESYREGVPDGEQKRDFVFVEDCVDVALWLLRQGTVSGIFNLGTGRARSFLDLARATIQSAEVDAEIQFIEMPEAIRDKYQYFTEASMSRLRQIGYNRPFTELEAGIARYVQAFLSADDPYR